VVLTIPEISAPTEMAETSPGGPVERFCVPSPPTDLEGSTAVGWAWRLARRRSFAVVERFRSYSESCREINPVGRLASVVMGQNLSPTR